MAGSGLSTVRMVARVTGLVQGVGLRWYVRRRAGELGLAGRAVNLADGSVEVVAEGPRDVCESLVDELRAGTRTPGRVERVTVTWGEPDGHAGFEIG